MLPTIRDSMTIYEVEDRCREIIEWAETASIEEKLDRLQGLSAISAYLEKKKLADPVRTAERHLERSVGQDLGPGEWGGDRKSDQVAREQLDIEATARHKFRLIAEYWEVIAPKLPCSRAEALRLAEAARRAVETKPPSMYTREGWDLASAETRTHALAYRGKGGIFNKQDQDNIEWARWSWNPVTGCLHNCPYCYARDIANQKFAWGFEPMFHPARLGIPVHMAVPAEATRDLGWRNVFVCSMADLFGKWVPEEWIRAVLTTCEENPQWNFLFLTKFPIRLAEFTFPDNAWVGTSVDCQARVANAERTFRQVRATVKWLSVEPMLEPLTFTDIGAFDWLVMGGASAQSGTPAWRPPRNWTEDLRQAATTAGVPVYEKTNLSERIRDYPGQPSGEDRSLPRALAYIPSIAS